MTKIAVLADLHIRKNEEELLKQLAENDLIIPKDSPIDNQELVRRTANAEVVLINPWTPIDTQYLNQCPNVRAIFLCGTSMAKIDREAVTARSIVVKNIVAYGDEPTAEFIFMQLVALARGVGQYQWQTEPSELMGKTIGIIGLGDLGKAIARIALAFKMETHYYSLHRKKDWEDRGLGYMPKKELLSASRIIIISSPTNQIVLDKSDFMCLQPNSILVQASIGRTFDQAAFTKWIKSPRNNYAIFDSAAGDTISNQYNSLPHVIFSKLIAGHTIETKQRLGERLVENIKTYLHDK